MVRNERSRLLRDHAGNASRSNRNHAQLTYGTHRDWTSSASESYLESIV